MKVLIFSVLLFGVSALAEERVPYFDSYNKPSGYQKPGANVRLNTSRIRIDNPGDVANITLTLSSSSFAGFMEVAIREIEGLDIVYGDLHHRIPLTTSGRYDIPLALYGASAGKFYLPMVVTIQTLNGTVSHRALSVIVEVGEQRKAARKVPASIQLSPRGRVIQSMSAQEEIIQK